MLAAISISPEAILTWGASGPAGAAGAVATAFVLGAVHALTPGHGKALVAAYLAGSGGRMADALFLGVTVTVTHTGAVFALGALTLFASHQFAPDKVISTLSVASAALVAVVGLVLVWNRSQRYIRRSDHSAMARSAPTPFSSHGHAHSHPHDHAHGGSAPGLLALGISGGLVPCPEALVVLLLAVRAGKFLVGLMLLSAFTLGLAAVLIAIGSVMVLAGPKFQRLPTGASWTDHLPLASAVFILILGLWMVSQAFSPSTLL